MNLNYFWNHQTKNITQAGVILAFSAFLSRVLGIARDWLLAKYFGAGSELDIYFTAFKIPDFVYNILILGGVLVSFLPLFSESFSQDPKKAWRFASNCINIFLLALILISFFLFIFTPSLMDFIAPGFDSYQREEAVLLSRIMFLSPIFFGLSSIFSGILQYFNRFLVYSLCPLLYNLGIIFGILFLSPRFGILGLALGVVTGAFLHFVVQVPSALKCGFFYKPVLDFKAEKIKRVFALMLPRTFGIAATQINLIAINAIASALSEGSISIFTFANNIRFFPVGIVGASFAMAAFPILSRKWAEGKKEEFISKFSSVFLKIICLIIPVSILMFVLREQIVILLLRHGQFSSLSAKLTSSSIALFCFGIFASSLTPLFFRGFFSLQDTKTPTLIAIFSVIISIITSLFFTQILAFPQSEWQVGLQTFFKNIFSIGEGKDISVLGLPLAVSISAILQLSLMVFFFKKKLGSVKKEQIIDSTGKVLMAALVMTGAVYLIFPLVNYFFDIQTFKGAFFGFFILSSVGALVYLGAALGLGLFENEGLKNFWNKK